MYDLLIKGGTVVDGTGEAAFTADVAVGSGKILDVGKDLGPAKREIDAAGLLVTPGFVDVHTHYDGQATWDPYLTPSTYHGVTTAIFGNFKFIYFISCAFQLFIDPFTNFFKVSPVCTFKI